MLIAGPRPTGSQMSAMTPPAFVSGLAANAPEKKRQTMSVAVFGASASPSWKSVSATSVPTKIGRRPIISLPGAQRNGPLAERGVSRVAG
jgi:hypothetical protein